MADTQDQLPDFDKWWDYGDPAATELRFRDLLPAAEASDNITYRLSLLTQIARCQGLQRRFDDAHATLDQVESALDEAQPLARVRYLLERGRAFNSGKQPEEARPLFVAAWELACAEAPSLDGYAVDAAHMMGIVEPTDEALAWNEKAMAYAEASDHPKAQKWLGSLYNNIGWTYHDAGDYEAALTSFRKGLAWRKTRGQLEPTLIAKWTVGRALRSLERLDEALEVQLAVEQERAEAGKPGGFCFEELGELYLATGRPDEARRYFAKALPLLSALDWLTESEPDRIERIKRLAGDAPAES